MYVMDNGVCGDFGECKSAEMELKQIVDRNQVVLFMKGDRRFPICGLSADVCFMLKRCNLRFSAVNLLMNPNLALFLRLKHEPILAPYLYAGGKFVGGYETISTMFDSGLLNSIVQTKNSD